MRSMARSGLPRRSSYRAASSSCRGRQVRHPIPLGEFHDLRPERSALARKDPTRRFALLHPKPSPEPIPPQDSLSRWLASACSPQARHGSIVDP